ncbi:MAG: L,D-transpeptidase [Terrimesophilobacter sp.]
MSTETPRPPRRRWIRISVWLGVALGAIAAAMVVVILSQASTGPTQTQAAVPSPSRLAQPPPSPSPTVPPAPAKPTQTDLAGVPLAFYDAVIGPLLDSSTITPVNQWKLAVPIDPLVALYSTPTPDATPIAALGSTVPTVKTPTVVAVYGVSGDMILVSTPSRNAAPGPGPAPGSTFAWARTADFTVSAAPHAVMVDNANSTISIVSASGEVSTSESARLGTPNDPTPAATATYIESIYVDKSLAYTRGNPIALTGAHSSTLIEYGGNSALTAIHYYPSTTGLSHGCVRVSAEMTKALAALPIGTPVIFS